MRLLPGRSIAVRLVISSLFWSSLVLLAAGLILSTLYRQASERGFDDLLLVYANDLAAELATPQEGGGERREYGSLGDPRFEIPLSGWYWQLGPLGAGAVDLKSSRSLVGQTLPTLAEPAADRPFGEIRKQSVAGPESRLLRVVERDIDLGEDGRYVVRVAGPADEITAAVRQFGVALVVTFLLVGLGLGLTTLLQVRFGLRPLSDLREAVAAIRRGQGERIPGAYPKDIAPLAAELNLLLDSNRDILERARTQVGNLAHALKTPLSVIVNEADRQPGDEARRVREQATLMRDQIDYYLQRARTAALAGHLGTVTEVKPVLDALARTFDKLFHERGLSVSPVVQEGARFRGERQDLEEMVGNLVDNACKWARSEVSLTVTVGTDTEKSLLHIVVEDDGPGMPDQARTEAVKRGKRLDETKPGSGLGLAIVTDLADLYGGRLDLGPSRLGGVRAELVVVGDATV